MKALLTRPLARRILDTTARNLTTSVAVYGGCWLAAVVVPALESLGLVTRTVWLASA